MNITDLTLSLHANIISDSLILKGDDNAEQ